MPYLLCCCLIFPQTVCGHQKAGNETLKVEQISQTKFPPRRGFEPQPLEGQPNMPWVNLGRGFLSSNASICYKNLKKCIKIRPRSTEPLPEIPPHQIFMATPL